MNRNERPQRPLRDHTRQTSRFSRTANPPRIAESRTTGAPAAGQRYSESACRRRETFETFAQSVSCLLSDDEPTPIERQALVSLVRQSFPEFTRAKASLTTAQERQQQQVERLGPHLLNNASFLTDPEAANDAEQTDIIDESARIMYELSRIDEQIEVLQQRINLLQHQIITWVKWDEPSNARTVRWALEHA